MALSVVFRLIQPSAFDLQPLKPGDADMDVEAALEQALHDNPDDDTSWHAVADWLEERADPRAELLRLHRSLREELDFEERTYRQGRLQELLEHGVRPWMPELVNSLGMRFALIPAGRFAMGSPDDEPGRFHDESPLHEVKLTRPFYLGVFPVTQAEFAVLTGETGSWFSPGHGGGGFVEGTDTGQLPADQIDWPQASDFCKAMNDLRAERAENHHYRLPTEAEWEYACRAWTTTAYHFGVELTYEEANFADAHCPRRTTAVGSYRPNAFGLYDMHGNVWEWCDDYWGENYEDAGGVDPIGPAIGIGHVIRGGSWADDRRRCRCACRYRVPPPRAGVVGFRVAMNHPV
jgi:uncharacterized protein (TIGR02996 family)